MRQYTTFATAILLVLASVSGLAAAQTATTNPHGETTATAGGSSNVTVSGTVTVANGTAEGDVVSVTPLTQNFEAAGSPINATVSNGTFDVTDVAAGQLYYVRLTHGDAAHYALVRNTTGIAFDLSATLSGEVVTPDGDPVSNATVGVQSSTGAPVATLNTSDSGAFSLSPVQPNRSYTLYLQRAGVPYQERIQTDADGATARIVTREPTANESVLTVTGGSPASHVVQLSSAQNGTGLGAVETVTVTNNGTQPFVGTITVGLPDGAEPTGAMYRDQSTQYTTTAEGVTVNATVAANASTRVGVAYSLPNQTLEKSFQHRTDTVAVVLRGYNLSRVDYSENLRTGEMPIAMLTNDEPLDRGESISVTLPEQTMATGADTGDVSTADAAGDTDDEESSSDFPIELLGLALAGTVVASLAAYRLV